MTPTSNSRNSWVLPWVQPPSLGDKALRANLLRLARMPEWKALQTLLEHQEYQALQPAELTQANYPVLCAFRDGQLEALRKLKFVIDLYTAPEREQNTPDDPYKDEIVNV
jgi:hypothetical protein